MSRIPENHPRYLSLMLREKISDGIKKGLVHETGLIAHGRGESFDYLIGEKTIDLAGGAEKVSAAMLLCAENPVISSTTPSPCLTSGNVAQTACQ